MIVKKKKYREKKFKNRWYNHGIDHDQKVICHSPDKIPTREEVLDFVYRTRVVPWYCTYLMQKRTDDYEVQEYMSEIWVQICKIKEEKWQDLYSQGKTTITSFVAVLIRQNVMSATSPCYNNIRRPNKKMVRIQDKEWEQYDENGEFPEYLRNGVLREIQDYDADDRNHKKTQE